MRVLLVEDNAKDAVLCLRILARTAVQYADWAQNQTDALQKARQTKPDVVLTDHRLGYGDGIGDINALRDLEGFDEVVMVLLSADSLEAIDLEPLMEPLDGFYQKWNVELDAETFFRTFPALIASRREHQG